MKLSQIAPNSDDWFEKLGEAINLPDSMYQAAERSYKSVSSWLERDDSFFSSVDFHVYTQGSFRLGTAIAPLDPEEEYDLDIVCQFSLSKLEYTQRAIHEALGRELNAYAARYGMEQPSAWDRCWTLNYAESAQFHMDVLPCVPDAARQRYLRESLGVDTAFVESAVSITDRTHQNFSLVSEEWPSSNPNGYANWFRERMKLAYDRRLEKIKLVEAKVDVDEIPEFSIRTPLQLAIQILKRHRDVYFSTRHGDLKPSSIVITTLAAHSYQQQSTVATALEGLLQGMANFVERKGKTYFIPNPSDPRENFADAWNVEGAKAESFYAWLEVAREDFWRARDRVNLSDFMKELAPNLGEALLENAFADEPRRRAGSRWKISRIMAAKHKCPPEWPVSDRGKVSLDVEVHRDGFRPSSIQSDDSEVARWARVHFRANTDVPAPFEVFWQVVNTGRAATDDENLRGNFDRQVEAHGHLRRTETAQYPGSHSIECFIVKNGFVAARSGIFIVNVASSSL